MPVVNFPSTRWPASDHAELARWGAVAPGIADWWVQPDPCMGGSTTLTDDGDEYASLSQGGPEQSAVYRIDRTRRRFELVHWRMGPVGTFRTLREALESVCRTLGLAAATA